MGPITPWQWQGTRHIPGSARPSVPAWTLLTQPHSTHGCFLGLLPGQAAMRPRVPHASQDARRAGTCWGAIAWGLL